MALDIHPSCLSRINEQLPAALSEIIVQNNMFIKQSSMGAILSIEKTLPNKGPLKDALLNYISEAPFSDFVYSYLSKELFENDDFNNEQPEEFLTELEQYKELELTTDKIIDNFKSLPWEYYLTVPLNHEISKYIQESEIIISPNVRLIRATGDFKENYPLKSGIPGRDKQIAGGIGLLSAMEEAIWFNELIYLQIKTTGYIGKWISTSTLERAITILKGVVGITIALRMFLVSTSYSSSIIKKKAYIHRLTNNSWVIEDKLELENDISKLISDLRVETYEGFLSTDEKIENNLSESLDKMSKALVQEELSERLILAGMWYFDSFSGGNELLSFVQTTVALEILLGDKAVSDLMGLGELLKNRCAYLIGHNYSQREKILADFKEIYDVRSNIVHRGKSKLTNYEMRLLLKLQWMVGRVIQEEVELIGRNEE